MRGLLGLMLAISLMVGCWGPVKCQNLCKERVQGETDDHWSEAFEYAGSDQSGELLAACESLPAVATCKTCNKNTNILLLDEAAYASDCHCYFLPNCTFGDNIGDCNPNEADCEQQNEDYWDDIIKRHGSKRALAKSCRGEC